MYLRILSPADGDYYILDTAFCVACIMFGRKLRVDYCSGMAFIGRKVMNCPVSEPNEHSAEYKYHLPYSRNI